MIAVFCTVIFLFSGIFFRTYSVSLGEGMAQVAKNQSAYTLEVARCRGMIYDRELRPLVNEETEYRAAILPGPQSAQAMQKLIPDKEEFLARLEERRPFVAAVEESAAEGLASPGVSVFQVPRRYSQHQPAVHVIGHLQDGQGAYGMELAYNDFLEENSSSLQVRYSVDATGRALPGAEPEVSGQIGQNKTGLVLTLDERIQRIVEYAARQYITKGAVVVMDCENGDILASLSLPEFDQENLAESFDTANSPFVNKALAGFSVGSSFKLIVIAAALEAGIEPGVLECTGAIDVGGQVFHCNDRSGHGWMDLRHATEQSCNPYFIHLALQVGAEQLRETALKFGFGSPSVLGPGYESGAGSVPTLQELGSPAALANFGFGQGTLMATPLQLAQAVSVFANGGSLVTPRLVKGISNQEGTALAQEEPCCAPTQIISSEMAARVRDLMISVVEEGSGRRAKPSRGGAGGKTASAQTGRYYDEQRQNEIVEAWFVGFFPAERPRYTMVVLAQGADSGSIYAAPIFKDIADGILALEEQEGISDSH